MANAMKRPFSQRVLRSFHLCQRCAATLSPAAVRRPNGVGNTSPLRFGLKSCTVIFYAGIMTIAARSDAQSKQAQRKLLDDAIEAVESDLKALDTRKKTFVSSHKADREMEDLDEHISRYGLRLDESAAHRIASRIMKRISFPESPLLPDDRSGVSPRSMYAREGQSELAKPTWTPKKATLHELALARLGMRLFHYAYRDRNALEESDLLHSLGDIATLDQLQYRIHELEYDCIQATGMGTFETSDLRPLVPHYNHQQNDTKDLDAALLNLANQHKQGRLCSTLFAERVAYNLLISSAPPYISTFHILISQFSKLGHYEMANLAVEAMYAGLVRPNEQLVSVCLNHFVRSRNKAHFHQLSERLRGHQGGLMAARSDVRIDESNSNRLIQEKSGKIIQAMKITPKLYETVGDGYLRQGGIREAEAWLNRMFLDGYVVSLCLLRQLLESYVRTEDYAAAFRLWEDLTGWFSKNSIPEDLQRDAVSCFRSILNIFQKTGKIEEYKEAYRQARLMGFSAKLILEDQQSLRPEVNEAQEDFDLKTHIVLQRLQWSRENLDEWTVQLYVSKILLSGRPIWWIAKYFGDRLNNDDQLLIKAREQQSEPQAETKAGDNQGRRRISNFFNNTFTRKKVPSRATITARHSPIHDTQRDQAEAPEEAETASGSQNYSMIRALVKLTERNVVHPYEVRRAFHNGRSVAEHGHDNVRDSPAIVSDGHNPVLPNAQLDWHALNDPFLNAIAEDQPNKPICARIITPYITKNPMKHRYHNTLSVNPLKQTMSETHHHFWSPGLREKSKTDHKQDVQTW